MTGCLALPFKLALLVALVAGGALAWLYRDRLLVAARDRIDGAPAAAPARGRPSPRGVASARDKVDSLNGWRADSVVLTAGEAASLIGDALPAEFRRQLDSVEVRLGDGELDIAGRLATARLPRELTGAAALALREHEPVILGGALRVRGAGRGELELSRATIRGVPLPRDLLPALVGRAFGDPSRRTIPVRIPPGVGEIRVRRTGVTLIGAQRP